jgi:hypothetical protein|eukprot:7285233-Prymnesium_polylepis.1
MRRLLVVVLPTPDIRIAEYEPSARDVHFVGCTDPQSVSTTVPPGIKRSFGIHIGCPKALQSLV